MASRLAEFFEPLDGRALLSGPPVVYAPYAPAAIYASPRAAGRWSPVNDFVYQLQDISLSAIARTRFDLAIIDYSADGSEVGRFSRRQIQALQRGGAKPELVLGYMSIGEAEDYRWYWNSAWDADHDGRPDTVAPSWLGPADPDWPGNYKVRYWDANWQAIARSYLDRIIAAGFDGAYLDVIDAFEYWGPGGESGEDRALAANEMIAFVKRLSRHARGRRGDFAVFVQNGESLGADRSYLSAISGIGREDVWFTGDRANPPKEVRRTIANLNRFRKAGKTVLCIDYVRRRANIARFHAIARRSGFIPYATVRELDRLTINKGHGPD